MQDQPASRRVRAGADQVVDRPEATRDDRGAPLRRRGNARGRSSACDDPTASRVWRVGRPGRAHSAQGTIDLRRGTPEAPADEADAAAGGACDSPGLTGRLRHTDRRVAVVEASRSRLPNDALSLRAGDTVSRSAPSAPRGLGGIAAPRKPSCHPGTSTPRDDNPAKVSLATGTGRLVISSAAARAGRSERDSRLGRRASNWRAPRWTRRPRRPAPDPDS